MSRALDRRSVSLRWFEPLRVITRSFRQFFNRLWPIRAGLTFDQGVANLFEQYFLTRRWRIGCRRGRFLQLVDAADGHENYEGNDEKVKYGLQKRTVFEQYRRAFGIGA